jgi:hypothetical protein
VTGFIFFFAGNIFVTVIRLKENTNVFFLILAKMTIYREAG